jgi:hypothetical protein
MQTFAILGSHPTLSLAELAVVTGQKPTTTLGDVAIFDDMSENLETLNAKLGGIQKIGVIIGSVPTWNHSDLTDFLVNDLVTESAEGKIQFGTSVYSLGNNSGTENARRNASKLGMEIKSQLQGTDHPARYVISSSPTLSSVVITKSTASLLVKPKSSSEKRSEYKMSMPGQDETSAALAAMPNKACFHQSWRV